MGVILTSLTAQALIAIDLALAVSAVMYAGRHGEPGRSASLDCGSGFNPRSFDLGPHGSNSKDRGLNPLPQKSCRDDSAIAG
jgi:hypothetical protein